MNDLKSLKTTIDTLRNLRCEHHNRHLVGLIGELTVLFKLIEEDKIPEHIGGTDLYDIECEGKRIEVKTSSTRSQKDGSNVWGWDLRRTTQKESNCSYFVCIQLDDNLEADKYLIY